VLKSFEKKDQHLKAMAATNLSFIYFLENDFTQVGHLVIIDHPFIINDDD